MWSHSVTMRFDDGEMAWKWYYLTARSRDLEILWRWYRFTARSCGGGMLWRRDSVKVKSYDGDLQWRWDLLTARSCLTGSGSVSLMIHLLCKFTGYTTKNKTADRTVDLHILHLTSLCQPTQWPIITCAKVLGQSRFSLSRSGDLITVCFLPCFLKLKLKPYFCYQFQFPGR
jgi:hypothetical protein